VSSSAIGSVLESMLGSVLESGLRAYLGACVRARTPAFGLIGIRMVIIGIRLQTWMRVIVDVDVSR